MMEYIFIVFGGMNMEQKKKMSISVKTIIGLALGVIAGLLLQNHQEFAISYIEPFGTLFLNCIKMIVVPLVLASIVTGTCGIGDAKKMGKIGGKTILYFLCTTAFAASIGIIIANVFRVGKGFELVAAEAPEVSTEGVGLISMLLNIVPSNPIAALVEGNMLQIIFFAVVLGGGIIVAGEKGAPLAKAFDSLAEVMYKVTGIIMSFTPIAVFALITPVVAQNGPKVLLPLISVVLAVYGGCILHIAVVYLSTVRGFAKVSPRQFLKETMEAIVFAFTTASSSATLPYSMDAAKRLGVPQSVRSFVLPLGSTINMDGTAIYQGICALFIANVYGIHLTLTQQISIVLTCTFASIGAAGIPGSAMVMLSMVLQSVGLPLAGISLVAGIDRITDMAPTATNITGDIACSVVVAATEKCLDPEATKAEEVL